ncbi:flagellar motor protein MotB [Psychromarinibacter halotolerans]|uniref:Flagellar motor protein MotB n=1 Tax=Psychromarinibacter halotolerans TaxID=1775175 RepID=A0ABV7GJH1_9RHOB|nr:flagellar motor protein MotB [Psychromarinibacter halotolerans]MDF0595824.1 flagellar motor protein MotB [Psychromarinibacter halotolerans]
MYLKNEPHVVIKRPKKVTKGHHGGNWKVAYADFMTALMAFFLLLWILSGSDEEQLRGLAEYFTPSEVPLVEISGLGVVIDAMKAPESEPAPDAESMPKGPDEEGQQKADVSETRTGAVNPWLELDNGSTEEPRVPEPTTMLSDQLADALDQIQETFAEKMELAELAQNLQVTVLDDGMTVEIVDLGEHPMFPTGSADPSEELRLILAEVVPAIVDLPLDITITGHTDAHPFRDGTEYGNWELSADRANATRRLLLEEGVAVGRIKSVTGMAAMDPLVVDDPTDARNRRVTIALRVPGNAEIPESN